MGMKIERSSQFIVKKIIDYNTLENIKFIDTQQNDVIFYSEIVKNATNSASTIEVVKNEIYVLKNSYIQKFAIEKYSGKIKLDNVCV